MNDQDAPTWGDGDGFCRLAAVRSHLTFEVLESDLTGDDHLGRLELSVSSANFTNRALALVSDGTTSSSCGGESCGVLYVDAAPWVDPGPEIIISFGSRITIGGDNGFAADLQGEIDLAENSAKFVMAHEGGWSPIARETSEFWHQLFRTPEFKGSLNLNVDGVYIEARAELVYRHDLVLLPGVLEFGGLAEYGTNKDGTPRGPALNVTLSKYDRNSTGYNLSIALDCTIRIGDGDGQGGPPLFYMRGRMDPVGENSFEFWTVDTWQPLPNALPILALPPFYGRVYQRVDGALDVYAQMGPIPDIVFGSVLSLKEWVIGVRYEAPPPGGEGLHPVAPPSPAPNAPGVTSGPQLTLNVSAGSIRLGGDGPSGLEFRVGHGIVSQAEQTVDLYLEHPGGWCPLDSLGVSFCTPQIHGSLRIDQLNDPYLVASASVPMDEALVIIEGTLVITDRETAGWSQAGTGGPSFGISMTQKSKHEAQKLALSFSGSVCINMTNTMCMPVKVQVARTIGEDTQSRTQSRRLVTPSEVETPLDDAISTTRRGRAHQNRRLRLRQLQDMWGKESYWAVDETPDNTGSLLYEAQSSGVRRRAQGAGGFGGFTFEGTYTNGDIKPLGFLGDFFGDMIVIKGTNSTPMTYQFVVDPFGDCKFLFDLGAVLQFTPPAILGLGGAIFLGLRAVGCLTPPMVIFQAALPTIHLPLDMEFSGLTLLISTYDAPEYTTIASGSEILVPPGFSMHWEGTSPLSVLCPVDVEMSFTFQSASAFGFSFACPEFELTLFDQPPIQIASINFIRLTAMSISASVFPQNVEFALSASFMLATGPSTCALPSDAECVRADAEVAVGSLDGLTFLSTSLASSGLWIEPNRLRNFAILDVHVALRITIPPPPAIPVPTLVAWAATIYYKPDLSNSRSNWPTELLNGDPTSADWPPNLDSYAYRNDEKALRTCESFFLYEQWHSEMDDPILRTIGLPRFAIKLRIPRLTLIDVLLMYADIQMSAYAARGIDVGGAPAAAASLISSVNEFLAIEMAVELELSLVETDSVPEWGGEPVNRGLYLNMSVEASNFMGFSFDFRVLAVLRLPNPSPELQAAFMTMLSEFFQNPMGIVTGEVEVPDIGFQAGMEIEALATLPFFPSRLYFFGRISITSFELRAEAMFAAGPFSLDVTLEILVSTSQLRLAFGGALELGPFGSVSVYGEMQANPAFFSLNGSFCRPMSGFDTSGSVAIDSRTGRFAFVAQSGIGFFGVMTISGGIEENSAAPNGVWVRGQASIDLSRLQMMVDDLINTIVRVVAQTTDPESSIVARALKLLFQVCFPISLIVRGTIFYDNMAGSMGIELTLNIFGERTFGFSLPTPVRRRQLSTVGEGLPDWPHPYDTRLNATRRRALSSTCGEPPDAPMTISDIVNKVRDTFSDLVAMARRIAPIDFSFAFAVNLVVLQIAGAVRFQLATSGHMSIELAASLSFLGIQIAGDLHLSTQGGIVSGRLFGAGETPKLCGACPVLKGSIEIIKTAPDSPEGSVVSVAMDLDMQIACFVVRGSALLDTAGGLRSFLLEASNPMCLVDVFKEAINSVVPGAGALLGDSLEVSVRRAKLFYSGTLGSGLSLTIDLDLMGQAKKLTFKASNSIDSLASLLAMLIENAQVLVEAFDDVLNVASLTFLDVTLGHAPVSWSAEIGDRDIAKTGKGVTIGGSLRLANTAWARMGFFGGGFGVDMDNYVSAGGFFMGSTFSMFQIELAIKVDATFRNPIAADLAEAISDTIASTGVKDLLDGNDGRTISKEAMADVKLIRDAACDLKEALATLLAELTTRLGALPDVSSITPTTTFKPYAEQNQLGRWMPQIITSMDELTTGILGTLELGTDVTSAMQSQVGLDALRAILERFAIGARDFFDDSSTTERITRVRQTARDVQEKASAMIATCRMVSARVDALTATMERLITTLTGDFATRLEQLSTWGGALSGVACLFKRTPDLGSQLAAVVSELPHRVLTPLRQQGQRFLLAVPSSPAPVTPRQQGTCEQLHVYSQYQRIDGVLYRTISPSGRRNASDEISARALFQTYSSLCPNVKQALVSLTFILGPSKLATYTEFIRAVGASRLRRAATLLERSGLCAVDDDEGNSQGEGGDGEAQSAVATFCADAATTLRRGCAIGPQWISRPDWLGSTFHASLVEVTARFDEVTLVLAVELATHGRAACSAELTSTSVSVRQLQRQVNVTFYVNSASTLPVVTDALASATVDAMRVQANGRVAVSSGEVTRWWLHYTPLFVDTSALVDLRVEDACSRRTANATSLELESSTDWTFVAPRSTPWPQTLLLSRQSQRPWPLVASLGAVCRAACDPGLVPAPISGGLDVVASAAANFDLPEPLARCLDYLRRDYASCGVEKLVADRRFAQCVGTNRVGTLTTWLHDECTALGIAANVTALVVGSVDCEAFTTLRAQHCICARTSGASLISEMRHIVASVGMQRDPNATNRPADVVAVRERLHSLGYGRGFSSGAPPADSCEAALVTPLQALAPSEAPSNGLIDIEMQSRLQRVALCAAAGLFTFEDECDVVRVNGNCAVRGVECPLLARTSRDTCVRLDEPCALGLVVPGSTEHDWLRSVSGVGLGAPGWASIPARGDGYELAPEADLYAYGTTWLVEMLLMAGRQLVVAAALETAYDLSAMPLLVVAASVREGGHAPGQQGHQTGLQLRLRLPLNGTTAVHWPAARAHVEALEAAGFAGVQLKGAGERSMCEWNPSLCIRSAARFGEMVARVEPPSLQLQRKLPRLLSSALAVAADGRRAILTVTGVDIGRTAIDVVAVAVGEHECELLALDLSGSEPVLSAVCRPSERSPWISGFASVTTADGERGLGSDWLTALLELPPRRRRPTPFTTPSTVPFTALPSLDNSSLDNSSLDNSSLDNASTTPLHAAPYPRVAAYTPPVPTAGKHIRAPTAPTVVGELRAVQSRLLGQLPACRAAAGPDPCDAMGPPSLDAPTSLPALVPWPTSAGTPTTMRSLLVQLARLDPHGLGGGGFPLPESYSHLHASDADGCIATHDVAGHCYAGVHAAFTVGGFLGLEAEARVVASVNPADAPPRGVFTPLMLTLAVPTSALPELLPAVYDGALAALPEPWAEGAVAFLDTATVTSASLHHSLGAADGHVQVVLTSSVLCQSVVLVVPLRLFDPYIRLDLGISRERLSQLLGETQRETLMRTLSSFAATANGLAADELITPNATTTFRMSVNDSISVLVRRAAGVSERSPPGWALTLDEVSHYFGRAGVCELSMALRYAERHPPPRPSQLCTLVTQWMDRAATLRVAIAEDASCGMEPAASEWVQLEADEDRLRTMHPHLSVASCVQTYIFLEGFHSAAGLPSAGLAHFLGEVGIMITSSPPPPRCALFSTIASPAPPDPSDLSLAVPCAPVLLVFFMMRPPSSPPLNSTLTCTAIAGEPSARWLGGRLAGRRQRGGQRAPPSRGRPLANACRLGGRRSASG